MKLTNLPAFLDHLTKEKGIPGNTVKIYQNHSLVFDYSSGFANIEKTKSFETSTLVNLYSASKVITCATALTLFEKGKFLMTDPLYHYIPEFRDIKVKDKDADGNEILRAPKRPIIIRDLFTMTAGFDYNLGSKSLTDVAKANPEASTLDFIRAMSNEKLCFDPGARWQYSLCHDVIGGLIEKLSDMTFEEYAKKAIFDKCGMENTGFTRTDEIYEKMADQFTFNEETKTADPVQKMNRFILGKNFYSGGAGIYSNADDYILFADAMACGGVSVTGERILSSATIDLMRTNCLDSELMKTFRWTQYIGYGYGFGVRTVVDKAEGGILSPIGEFGWCGAAGSMALIDPVNKLSMFYCQHMLNPQEPYIFPRLRNIAYAELSDFIF